MGSTDEQVSPVVSDDRTPTPHPHFRKSRPSRELHPDVMDLMGNSVPFLFLRHHSGPFNAVTNSAYLSKNKSPLVTLEISAEQALKATPEIPIQGSLNKHVPFQNTAIVTPGNMSRKDLQMKLSITKRRIFSEMYDIGKVFNMMTAIHEQRDMEGGRERS